MKQPSSRAAFSDPARIAPDASLLEPVPPPAPSGRSPAITVSPSGHVALNGCLREAAVRMAPALRVDFSASADRTYLVLRPSAAGPYQFPKSGRIKDVAFSRSLVAAGISLPARYAVTWNEAAGGWVGVLDRRIPSTARQALLESLRSPRRKRGA